MLVTSIWEVDLKKLATLRYKLRGHQPYIAHSGRFKWRIWRTTISAVSTIETVQPEHPRSSQRLHCGCWQYLHEDFGDIQLSRGLIASPSVELWLQWLVELYYPML